ncbi:hypothetical protein [Amphiplicatus metriothermophilus]|uniref:Uncharacterized protein n=1 Tax=Amphiplicatus metriothermophilus TaxID=1519374 RepID=A0A239PK16_9PROT|nr:hypothetical protein [Amphiplicatus metriothermophilus]MBB5517751.1 hypothetical protein [Amphiplicatus metriothermophilus]SNT67915.1 hypothetical protein SAMN06297382_0408 [Amphiplicatus metriothermophilus]
MIAAELIARRWRRVDVKLVIDGEMHVLRWRRGRLYLLRAIGHNPYPAV